MVQSGTKYLFNQQVKKMNLAFYMYGIGTLFNMVYITGNNSLNIREQEQVIEFFIPGREILDLQTREV
jgi:hypothetical protein